MTHIHELEAAARYYGESEEPWKALHEEANACHKIEKQLVYGLYIFDQLESAEKAWRDTVASGLTQTRKGVSDAFERAWRWWLAPCDQAETAIRWFEARGYQVDPARAFRERCERAQRRVRSRARTGSWRLAVKNADGRLFGRPAITEEELRQKSEPFPDAE